MLSHRVVAFVILCFCACVVLSLCDSDVLNLLVLSPCPVHADLRRTTESVSTAAAGTSAPPAGVCAVQPLLVFVVVTVWPGLCCLLALCLLCMLCFRGLQTLLSTAAAITMPHNQVATCCSLVVSEGLDWLVRSPCTVLAVHGM